MSIRDILKKREEDRDKAANGESEFPEGVTRYVRVGSHGEINKEGRTLVMLAPYEEWYVYFVHENKEYTGKGYDHKFRKHTCLHSPRSTVSVDELQKYFTAGKNECISCKAGAKRKMFFMIPVYDPKYKTYRVIDIAEFHANKLMDDFDKAEKPVKKIQPDYTIVGQAVHFKQADKTYSLETGDLPDDVLEEAKAFIGIDYKYEELANFRDEEDILKILHDAKDGVKKSVLPPLTEADNEISNEISDDDLPF
ncbi:single-stranded DNA-binding protein [Bacillus glycinifermentans]|uniref:single-stranded DNA-binding protein n=1 Tax=Bacillus glycinifermentans TaxID=1664069 RepID=UPI001FF5BE1E|nr:single-stranded DNA-binding protein [Bacillus glycinifermentans]UOY86850.1 single-stranded DNA-binding protein [Bacillus glycinifermentans]